VRDTKVFALEWLGVQTALLLLLAACTVSVPVALVGKRPLLHEDIKSIIDSGRSWGFGGCYEV
jgi:hypothetical protein